MDTLSRRGRSNVVVTLAKLPKAMLDDREASKGAEVAREIIDLSMAENWLIRQEVLDICKPAIAKEFDDCVRLDFRPFLFLSLTLVISISFFPCLQTFGAIPRF